VLKVIHTLSSELRMSLIQGLSFGRMSAHLSPIIMQHFTRLRPSVPNEGYTDLMYDVFVQSLRTYSVGVRA
jgi:hypothetical protein